MKKPGEKGQWAVRILCALALLFVGFAHQPAAMAENTPFDITAYALPDGSLPVLCVSENDGSQKDKDKHLHSQGCEACRIGASVLLPQPADALGKALQFSSAVAARPMVETAYRRIFSPATAPRAPPFI